MRRGVLFELEVSLGELHGIVESNARIAIQVRQPFERRHLSAIERGLPKSFRTVEMHGGAIGVASGTAEPRGTTMKFGVTLPMQESFIRRQCFRCLIRRLIVFGAMHDHVGIVSRERFRFVQKGNRFFRMSRIETDAGRGDPSPKRNLGSFCLLCELGDVSIRFECNCTITPRSGELRRHAGR